MAFFSVNDIFGNPKPKLATPQQETPDIGKMPYNIVKNNWFSAKPYGFKFTDRNGKQFTMFLPIGPNNITISTGFATNIVTSIYGVIEQHSPVRYFDITISGNTGMAPKYYKINQETAASGRSTASVIQGLSSSAGGFFFKTLSLIDKISNTASELVNGAPKAKTGVMPDQTGYVAFHNLYRFLLKYKEDAAGSSSTAARSQHPLIFFNYKDNNKYNVIVRDFKLTRSASDPMLYNYSIVLRGYNLDDIDGSDKRAVSEEERLTQLGLNGVDSSSLLGKIKGTADKVKGILGPLGAGINILGR